MQVTFAMDRDDRSFFIDKGLIRSLLSFWFTNLFIHPRFLKITSDMVAAQSRTSHDLIIKN